MGDLTKKVDAAYDSQVRWEAKLATHALPESRLEARLKKKGEQVKELAAQLDAALFVVAKQTETITNLLKRVKA